MKASGASSDNAWDNRAPNSHAPNNRVSNTNTHWWVSGWAYFLILAAAAAIPLTFQAGRRWNSRIFEPPDYMNRDAREWLAMAGESKFLHSAAPMRLARPLYPAGAWLLKHTAFPDENPLTLYRALNFFWLGLALWGLRRWTLHWTPDPRAPLRREPDRCSTGFCYRS